PASFRDQADPAALAGRQARLAPRGALADPSLEDRRLARARGLRSFRRLVHRPPRPAPHPSLRGLGRTPFTQGLRVPAGVSRYTRTLKESVVSSKETRCY